MDMRTAEEILRLKFPNASHLDWFKPIVDCINEARIEVVKECAEIAEADYLVTQGGVVEPFVNKESILELIEQVK